MKKKILHSSEAPDPIGPYSQAVQAGETLYVSGQIPFDVATGIMTVGDIAKEVDQVMHNIGAILDAANMNFSNVVKCSIFLRNMEDFPTVNERYGKHFGEQPPARETVAVSGLPKGVNVEISCVAVC